MIKFFIPFLEALILSIIFVLVFLIVGKKIKCSIRKSARHIHLRNVSRWGGAAMIIAFNLAILINRNLVIIPALWGVMGASLILLIVGTWDDLKELYWKTQLFYQVALAVLIFVMGVRIPYTTNPLTGGLFYLDQGIWVIFSILIVIFWVTLMINAMNWVDGIDGLSGGITFIGALTIAVLSLKPEVNQPPMVIMAMILAGVSLGFLIFNFYPSRILAGTSGATFMGFMLAVLAIFAGTKIATSLLVMAIPLVDFIWVVGERWRKRKSIFLPDRSHLHYKLMELGWSQVKINTYFYTVTILIAILALNTRAMGKILTLLSVSLVILVFILMVNNELKKNKKTV
ncbi:MAG: MraY family glycosyltransferase [Candidatus Moranbacteria bacterium]|nr:MraY family glycosyltransferase [Candidatus Moranbacteria bacterium]